VNVLFTVQAEEDLLASVEFLVERNPEAAARFSDRVFAAVEMLASNPVDGPVHRLSTGEECRSWPVAPVRIFYARTAESLTILRIYHDARVPILGPR
jgi:plasmid stabilization system protein ParE